MKLRLGLALTALSAVAAAETVNLWNGAPVPRAAELERLEGVEFSVIKKHEPEQDGYDWLHGVALCWHKGRLWASYGTNRGKENTPTEEAHVRVSGDGGKTWGAVQPVLLGALHTGYRPLGNDRFEGGGSPFITYYASQIQAVMDSLCEGYTLRFFDFQSFEKLPVNKGEL